MTMLTRAALPLLLLACSSSATAQAAEPWWLHVSPLAGAVVASVPGEAPRAAAALHIELSRSLPFGFGVGAGYLGGSGTDDPREVAGPWAEAAFTYRFRLRFRGHLAPFAGPVAGVVWHERRNRWFFGGLAGIDVPVGRGWPAFRLAATYRNIDAAGGLGDADVTSVVIGFRWSHAFSPGSGN